MVGVQVEELAKAKLEKPKQLRELAAKEWREIDDGTLVFDRPSAEVAALRTLSKSDLLQFFKVRTSGHNQEQLNVSVSGALKE